MNHLTATIKAIKLYPADDSEKLEFTSRGRFLRNNCYSSTNDVRYLKAQHRQARAEWSILKEDSKGDESTAKAIQDKQGYMATLEPSLDSAIEVRKCFEEEHLKFFGKEYTQPVKGTKHLSSQEVDSNYEPKQY
jgi:hypothetical protein